jgi:hypothetical protein
MITVAVEAITARRSGGEQCRHRPSSIDVGSSRSTNPGLITRTPPEETL